MPYRYWVFLIGMFLFMGCGTTRVGTKDSTSTATLVDSVLRRGLDHEALFSLLDTLKPMSSLADFDLPLGQRDSVVQSASSLYARWEAAAAELNRRLSDRLFFLVPFRNADSASRSVTLYVANRWKWQACLARHSAFFHRVGIFPSMPPQQVVTITEHLPRADRWRSYGYLFGYPNHAVDFFVSAGVEQDSTKRFVKREFIQMPVHQSETGYFTYAVPVGHQRNEADRRIETQAAAVLKLYRQYRPEDAVRMKKRSTLNWLRRHQGAFTISGSKN